MPEPGMTGAERIAHFTEGLRSATVPDAVMQATALHMLDAVGVGLAAAPAPHCAGWAKAAEPGKVPLFAGGRATAADAAMVNGALIHALEYDDTHVGSVVHGSAVATPVALAGAGPDTTGREVLLATLLAWEVMVRVGRAAPGAFQARGFQVTSVAGAVGAAAAAAFLVRMDRASTVSAMGIAGAQASGSLAFLSDGSTAKAMNPGWAARTGITAARMALAGMTGPADILEGRFGVMAGFAGGVGALSAELGDLGDRWHQPDAAFKLWPCCHYIHPFLELAGRLREAGVRAGDVERLVAHVPPPMAPLICEPWERRQAPTSGYDAKWGLPYCMGLVLIDGAVDVASFETAPRDDVIALARRMEWREMADHGFPDRFAARLDVTTSDGSLTEEVETVRGGADRPAAEDEIRAKFRRNASRRLSPERVHRLERALTEIADAPDLSELFAVLD